MGGQAGGGPICAHAESRGLAPRTTYRAAHDGESPMPPPFFCFLFFRPFFFPFGKNHKKKKGLLCVVRAHRFPCIFFRRFVCSSAVYCCCLSCFFVISLRELYVTDFHKISVWRMRASLGYNAGDLFRCEPPPRTWPRSPCCRAYGGLASVCCSCGEIRLYVFFV